jgi:hypothetical protein
MSGIQSFFSRFREQMFSSAMGGGSSHLEPLTEVRFKNFLRLYVKDYCDIYEVKKSVLCLMRRRGMLRSGGVCNA